MLRILKKQMAALEQDAFQRFLERLQNHICQSYPEEVATLTAKEVRGRIQVGLKRAEQWGFGPEGADRNGFVSLMFEYAPDFDEQPSIRSALERTRGTEDRWEAIFSQTTVADWKQAEDESKADPWCVNN